VLSRIDGGGKGVAIVDSDLAESISALKTALGSDAQTRFGKADPSLVEVLKTKLKLPRRYRQFLLECDPLEVNAITPIEHIRLIASSSLEQEQVGRALGDDGKLIPTPLPSGWRPGWIIIAQSELLGDPYFLDVNAVDAEGDCPVYSAMSGTDTWQPKLCASSFAMFVRILAITIDVARGFDVGDYDSDNEHVFREAIAPKIREYDPAAVKAKHWT
jgi:hypothetical protein